MSCQVKGECFCFEIQFDVRNEHTLSTQRQTTLTFTLTHILRLCSICQRSWSWSWFFQVVGDFISSKLICCELFHNSMDILCGLMLQMCKLTSANCCLLCKVKLRVKCIELEKPRWNKHVEEHVQGAADADDLLKSWKYFAVSFFSPSNHAENTILFSFFFTDNGTAPGIWGCRRSWGWSVFDSAHSLLLNFLLTKSSTTERTAFISVFSSPNSHSVSGLLPLMPLQSERAILEIS